MVNVAHWNQIWKEDFFEEQNSWNTCKIGTQERVFWCFGYEGRIEEEQNLVYGCEWRFLSQYVLDLLYLIIWISEGCALLI